MSDLRKSKKVNRKPIAQELKRIYRMSDGEDVVLSPVDELVQLIQQWAALSRGADPIAKESARQRLREVAEAAIETRVRPIGAGRGGAKSGEAKTKAAADRKDALTKKFRALIATGDRDASEAISEMIEKKLASRTLLYKVLQPELIRLGRTRKTSKALSAIKIRKPAK